LLGTSGEMVLEVQEGVTLTVANGLTVGPGSLLKGTGNIVGDNINDEGIVTGGMPEPRSST